MDAKEPLELNAESLMAQANELGNDLRQLIMEVKKLPRPGWVEAHQDPVRSLALAQAHLQTGFMWLRKAIEPTKDF